MVISPVIFLSEYLFLWIFSYLRTTDIDLYFNMYTLTSNLGFPLGGIFFGLSFWILASNLKIISSKSQSLVRFKESIYFTSIGIILLTSSTASLDITKLPYPPFGLISFTFLNVGAFSFFLGIYTLATAMAGNPNIRSTIRNSEFLHSIATSQDILNKKTSIGSILNSLKNQFTNITTADEEMDKEYLANVIAEKNRNITIQNRFEYTGRIVLGKSREEWVAEWSKWFYSVERAPSLAEATIQELFCQYKNQDIYFLKEPFMNTFEKKIQSETTIRKNKMMLVPLISNIVSFYSHPEFESAKDLKLFAKNDIDKKQIIFLSINDMQIMNIQDHRITSDLFEVLIPERDKPPNRIGTKAISEGYWLFLRSMPVGTNTIKFRVKTVLGRSEVSEEMEKESRLITIVIYD